jgi:hypothetical protein
MSFMLSCPKCSREFPEMSTYVTKLESENKRLQSELTRLSEHTLQVEENHRNVCHQLQEADKYAKGQYKAYEETIKRYREALDKCVKWIEPVMDGFSLDKNARSRVKVLNVAKSALEGKK